MMFSESLQVLKGLSSPDGAWKLVEIIGEVNLGS